MNEARWARVAIAACVALSLQSIRGTVADVRGLFADRRADRDTRIAGQLGSQLRARLSDTLCLASWPHDTAGPPARDSLRKPAGR